MLQNVRSIDTNFTHTCWGGGGGCALFCKVKRHKIQKRERDKKKKKKKKKKKEETSALLCSFFFAFEIFFTHSSNQMSNETGDFYCMNTRAQFCGVPRASVFGEY